MIGLRSLQPSLFFVLLNTILIEAKPKCVATEFVICTAGRNDYSLVRGLVSDSNTTTSIILRACRITDVQYESFTDLPALTYLDLSKNKISELKLGVLDEPKQITFLNLSNNMLEEFPLGLFDQTTKIETLSLKGNKIKKLELGIFDPLKNLNKLDLSYNAFRGKDLNPYIFDQSPHIAYIDFSGNDMTDSPSTLLHAFTSLHFLYLDKTLLKEIPAFATGPNLKTMKELILTSNQISSLNDSATFINLESLEILDLSHNNIDNIHGDSLSPLKNLKKFILGNNQLKTIPDNLFRNMPKLISVHLLGNKITDVNVNAFRGSPVKNLNLSSNKITYLVDNFCLELRNSGGKLKKFLFHSNPWQCACLMDVLNEVKKYGIEYNSAKYNGKEPVCVTTQEFNCKRHQSFNEVYIDLYRDVISQKH